MKNGFLLLTAAAFALGALTAAAQTPPPPPAPPTSSGDAQVRTKQVQIKQRKFDYYIKDGTNQLNYARSRFLAGRKDLCENNLILSQLRVDVTLSLMRDHPNELANLSGFFVLKSTRDGYFKSYTEYNRQVLALQDEIRLFAERNGPFAAFNYYMQNLKQKVIEGGEAVAPNIERVINDAQNQNKSIDANTLRQSGGGGAVTGLPAPAAGGPPSAVARAFFANPSDPAALAAFVQQAVAGGLSPAVASQLAAAFAAGDIRTVAQIAAQNPQSAEAQQALAALLQRLGVANGLQQLGMSSEDAQAADAAFRSGNLAALEALKEKYKDNPAVVAALNALINQLRTGGTPVAAVTPPSVTPPVVPVTPPPPVTPPATTTTPTPPSPPAIAPGGAPPVGTKIYDSNGNLVDIWTGGADPSEGTRARYADERGGRLSSEVRMTRQFIARPGGGYNMTESEDASSRTEWALDIAPKGDPEPAGDGLKVTFEVTNLLNPASRFEVTAWTDAKGQRIASTSKTFTTVVPKAKFTIFVEGKTQTFKNGTPFKFKVEGGQ